MLVLNRKKDESIIIGDTIVLTVLAIEGEHVKLGIEAPRDVTILRREVFDAVQDQVKIQKLMAEDSKAESFGQLRDLLSSESEQEQNEQSDGDNSPD